MKNHKDFAFSKANYMLMLLGVLILIIGFFIMASDSETFGFGFLGLTLGPLVVMAGFAVEFWAIFYKKSEETTGEENSK